jgi:serine/threonine protein kinase
MSDVSLYDRALARSQSPAGHRPRDERPLAGIACCLDLPAREGIGPPLEQELPPGFLLDGRFLLGEAIGRSGMATIYRANDGKSGAVVAVKVPLMKLEIDPVSYGRFQREERIGSSLDDPFLLKFVPSDSTRSRPYIVTEFLDGCTLAWVIHRTRPVPEKDALRIASAVCQAVGHMHGRRFIHRDLKPANIMICRDGRLCLMDFGLAAEIDTRRSILAGLTPLFGTPEYMAPEQVRNKRNDQRTDIYSLGVILYQMLTGVLPFQGVDPWEAAHMRVNGDPVSPRSLNPAISPQAEEIVLRAMRRNPAERYPTVAAFQAELDKPDRVHVTGLSARLQAPRWRMSLEGTPVVAGLVIGVAALLFMVGLFLVLLHLR